MSQKVETCLNDLEYLRVAIAAREKRGVELQGACKTCGKCCEGEIKTFEVDHINGEITIAEARVKGHCEAYNRKTKRCDAYDRRPIICRLYPMIPEMLIPGCGFHFTKTGRKK